MPSASTSARSGVTEMVPPPGGVSPVVNRLLTKGPDTLGHETNLARAPLWEVRSRAVQLELIAPSILYGHQFRQVAGQRVTVSDQRLFAEITTGYVRSGCREDRRVPFSLGWAAKVLGYGTLGGETRRLVRSSLSRLRSVTVESALREPGGHETVAGWGLVDRYLTTTRGGGLGSVTLSEEVARLLRAGSVTYLHGPTWDAIAAQDAVAGRLWTFLEAEEVSHGRRYSLFAGPQNGLDEERNMPAVADLLRLDWSKRRNVADRVRQACEVIRDHDPRYTLSLVKGRGLGMWRLEVARGPHTPSGTASPLPPEVMSAWRRRYRGRRPSSRQVAVVREVLARHPAEWVASTFEKSSGDALRELLDADSGLSRARLASALAAERTWASEKAEATVSVETVGAILRRMASLAQRVDGLDSEPGLAPTTDREFPGRQ